MANANRARGSGRGRAPGKSTTTGLKPGDTPGVPGEQTQASQPPTPNRARAPEDSTTTGLAPSDTPGVPTHYGTVNPNQDMSGMGEYEQWFQQNEEKFARPGLGEDFFGRTGEGYSQEGLGEKFASQNAQALQSMGQGEQWWNKYQGQFNQATASEQLQQDPGLDAYYGRARERAAGDINNQLAARGQFGSSAGLAQISDAMVGLGAEQANREADYRKEVAGQADEARGARLGLGGTFAGQTQDRFGQRIEQGMQMQEGAQNQLLDRLGMGQTAAGGVDAQRLNNLIAGGNAALGSQNVRTDRVQNNLDNRIKTGDIASGIVGGGLQNIANNDQKLWEAAQALGLGGATQSLNFELLDQAIRSNDMDAFFTHLSEAGNAAGGAMGGGGGGSRANIGGAMGGGGGGGGNLQADIIGGGH